MPRPATEIAPPYQRVFTGFANVAGIPAISLPGTRSESGLPIGFQLVAPFGQEARLIAIAKVYEAAYPWVNDWPSL
jgi:aspartyl-tRNA(Asn)/glutamyl-tRNA(Gln) amidotransferase subunit A